RDRSRGVLLGPALDAAARDRRPLVNPARGAARRRHRVQSPLGRSDGQLAALARESGGVLAPVLQKDEPRLLGDPALSVPILVVDVVVGDHVIGIHLHTAFSAASPLNVPRREAPMVWPSTWWYA